MSRSLGTGAVLLLALCVTSACASGSRTTTPPLRSASGPPSDTARTEVEPPDVVVEVPKLKLDSLHLVVDSLDAHVYLQARVANLLHLTTRVDVTVDSLALGLSGLDAEAFAAVRLDDLVRILSQLLSVLENKPELVKELLRSQPVPPVGGEVQTGGSPTPPRPFGAGGG